MDDGYLKAKEILKKHKQEHLLLKYDELSKAKQKELINQILSINFDLMDELYKNASKKIDFKGANIEPIEYIDKSKLTVSETKKYEEKGNRLLN